MSSKIELTKEKMIISEEVEDILRKEKIGKRVAKVSEDIMKKLGVKEGDILEIECSRNELTYADFIPKERRSWEIEDMRRMPAIVWQGEEIDEDSSFIRLDRFSRRNITTLIGETVKVKRADVKECEETTVYPLTPMTLKSDNTPLAPVSEKFTYRA